MRNSRSRARLLSGDSRPYSRCRQLRIPSVSVRKFGRGFDSDLAALPVDQVTPVRPEDKEAKANSLIMIDWDDTLNPSYWCLRNGILTLRYPSPSEVAAVKALSEIAARTIRMCMERGHVVIVTNAETGWVELSAKILLPDVFK